MIIFGWSLQHICHEDCLLEQIQFIEKWEISNTVSVRILHHWSILFQCMFMSLKGKPGKDGEPGQPGRDVSNSYISNLSRILIHFSSGMEKICVWLSFPSFFLKGLPGGPGINGAPGRDGEKVCKVFCHYCYSSLKICCHWVQFWLSVNCVAYAVTVLRNICNNFLVY